MAQTTLTIYAGDQLYKLVEFSIYLFLFSDYPMTQLLYPTYWDIYWSRLRIASLVYWWVPLPSIVPPVRTLYIQVMPTDTEMLMGQRQASVSFLCLSCSSGFSPLSNTFRVSFSWGYAIVFSSSSI